LEKIIVDFKEVRGLGNIISPKALSDFETYHSNVTDGTDVVAGASSTVYHMVYFGESIVVTVSAQYVKSGGTVTVTVTVTDENGDPLSGASVELFKEVN
jgi:protocatechuate 3,4-dioxygenase beta subunit